MTARTERLLDGVDPRLTDAVLALAVSLVVAVVIAADPAGLTQPGAYGFALGFGALVLLRRVATRLMLVCTLLAIFVYYALGFAPIGMVLPAVGALFSAAELRRTRWAVGAAAVLLAVATYFRLTDDDPAARLQGYTFVTELALAAAAIALGATVRLTGEARERTARIEALTAAERASETERRVQAERMRLARELHDSVGHNLAVSSLHAGVADEAIGRDDETARAAVARVRESTSATLRELRATVRVLRAPHEDLGPGPDRPGQDRSGPDRSREERAPKGAVIPAPPVSAEPRTADDAPPPGVPRGVPGIERRRPGEAGASARPVVEAGSAEPPGLAGLDGLLAAVRSAGLAVTATIGTSTTSLPADVDAAAFRIVQEALTNVIRHAGATSARIVAGVDDGLLRLVVADDGRGDAAGSTGGLSEGTGIAGMRERTALLGGTLTAEPSPDGGFVVIAVLPIAAAPPREETEESR